MEDIITLAKEAREATWEAQTLSTEQKNFVLLKAAEKLLAEQEKIVAENQKDLEAGEAKGLTAALLDRLKLNASRIQDMARGLKEVAELPDPVGQVTREWTRPNGLKVQKVRIPLGVIGIIYESRPNVTVDAAGLCLKSGNVVILRGGSEAIHSNRVLGEVLQEALEEEGLNPHLIQVVPTPDRAAVQALLAQDEYIDLIIPRGGQGLMNFLREYSKIPVVKHDKGVCHVYVDEAADLSKALAIAINAKVQRPGVCNAMETLLVDEAIVQEFLPQVVKALQAEGVEIRACEKSRQIVPSLKAAVEEDWGAEYLDKILAVRVVKGLDGALEHIHHYSSLHTESIVTEDKARAERFLKEANSSAVMVNASTRFNDGGQLGLGAEIGISTTKLHAFGPMGLEELTTEKYVIRGEGQVRV